MGCGEAHWESSVSICEAFGSTPSTGENRSTQRDTESGDPRLSLLFLYSHNIGAQAGCAVCGQDRRQSASALPLLSSATASLGGGQRRAALAMLGGAHFLGMKEAVRRAGSFMAQKRFQQPKPGKAALDCSRPPGMTLDEL